VTLRHSLLSGIRSGIAATRAGAVVAVSHTERDLPMKPVLIATAAFVLPLALLYYLVVGDAFVAVCMTVIMIVTGFLFCSVSGYMAGLVGSSNNPVSGITIGTILLAAAVLMLLMGRDAALGPVAAIMIGAVVCCAAAIAGDNLQDLKCGYLLGATPWRQQVMLAIGAVSCALVMAPVLNLLNSAYGIGVPTAEHPNPLLAPQATLMASVATGLFGGSLPWSTIATGAAVGVVIIAMDAWLKRRGSGFRIPVLAAAVGIYLPLELTVPIFLGGVIAYAVEQFKGVDRNDAEAMDRTHRRGVLFSAGLIAGEALMGILIAIPIVTAGRADVLALPESLQFGGWAGLLCLAAVAFSMYRVGARHDAA
jgi:putative OPT family oligopeptide transporter